MISDTNRQVRGTGSRKHALVLIPAHAYARASARARAHAHGLDYVSGRECYITTRGQRYAWEYYGTFSRSLYTLFQVCVSMPSLICTWCAYY